MAAKIIRKKRLFEDDANNQQPAQQLLQATPQPAAPAATTSVQPAPTTLAAPAALPQQTQPADTTQQLQLTLQPNQQLQQSNQPNQTLQAVLDILQQMQNTYWCIANNVPEMIKQKITDFTPNNEQAKPIIALWDAFKKDPNENNFNAFVDGFKTFGSAPADNSNQQQAAPVQPQNNVSASIAYNFTSALHENLNKALHQKKVESTFKTYF